MTTHKWILMAGACCIAGIVKAQTPAMDVEPYRPQIHFSPKAHWVNDPNGMVYHKGVYHLFFQYYPDSTVWGPMHWGHATSKDLLHWAEQPIGLYPDSLGYIFSGSAVVDKNNTSGFGKNGQVPLVAIFTHHDPVGERNKTTTFQYQSLAFSLDDGNTWTKYAGNPVLKNPGIVDFRDPKVMWYAAQKKWIMTLATKDRITFYSSPDLKAWTKESEFGEMLGAHGGVWECPDLFQLNDNGKQVWVLLVSINPGAPNKGSGTQYFIGDFDGKHFTPVNNSVKWIDYGTDNYAGITWSNTGERKIFLGWMNNWQYANQVPTGSWRGAMTFPRELKLRHVGKETYLVSLPVKELTTLQSDPVVSNNISLAERVDLVKKMGNITLPCVLDITLDNMNDFTFTLSNKAGEELLVGYDQDTKSYFIDRTKAGIASFEKGFAARHTAPRFSTAKDINIRLLIDVASVELFADEGLTVMTDIFFPSEAYNQFQLSGDPSVRVKRIEYAPLKSTLQP